MTARRPGETLDELRARLRNGQWNPIDSRAATALLPVNKWGTKAPKNVWRAQISRWTGEKFEFDNCGHNHLRRNAADECADKTARRLNRLAKAESESAS